MRKSDSAQDLTLPWTKCPTTELSLLLLVLGHISLSWRNLSKRKVQRRMWRSISLSLHFVVKPVGTLFQFTNVSLTIECSTSRTLAARASLKLLSIRFVNIHSETLVCMLTELTGLGKFEVSFWGLWGPHLLPLIYISVTTCWQLWQLIHTVNSFNGC